MGNQLRFFIFLTLLGFAMATWKEFLAPVINGYHYISNWISAYYFGRVAVDSVNKVATTKEERSWVGWIKDIGFALMAIGGFGALMLA